MRRSRLTAVVIGVAGLVAALLVAPLASPASATGPADRIWTLFDGTEIGGHYGIYTQDGVGGSRTAIHNTGLPYVHYQQISASGDGTRVIYLRLTGLVGDVRQEIVVRDIGTRQVRVLASRLTSSKVYLAMPSLSPDGKRAVWQEYLDTTSTYTVRRAFVGYGDSIRTANNLAPYAFLTNSLLLVQDATGKPFTMPFGGGTPKPVSGLPAEAWNVRVSPDGNHLTWTVHTNSTAPYRSKVVVAPLSLVDQIASVGTAKTIDSSLFNRQPHFSSDGSRVFYIKDSGAVDAPGDIYHAPADGSAPAVALAKTAAPEWDVAVTKNPNNDSGPPGGAPPQAISLEGTRAVVRWTLPTDADLSGTIVVRTQPGVPGEKRWWLPAPISYLKDSGLTLGKNYRYLVATIDRSGRGGTSYYRDMTALQAAPLLADPTALTSVKAAFPVTFGPVAPSGARFTAQYVPSGSSVWQEWVTEQTGTTRVFGSPGAAGVAATTSTPGKSYTFKVQVKDQFGNTSPWVNSIRAVVPFDQTKATFSGGSNASNSSAYLGGYRKLWRTTDYAKVTLTGNRLQVIGFKCSACGVFALYDNGKWVANVDTYASTTKARQVLFTRSYTSVGSHSFTIKPKATAGRPNVMLDGFAIKN